MAGSTSWSSCTTRGWPRSQRWVEPFLASVSDVSMRIVELVAEGDRVVGRLSCSRTPTTIRGAHDRVTSTLRKGQEGRRHERGL